MAAALTATGHWTAGLSAPLRIPDATTLVMKLNLKDFCFSLSLNQTCVPGGVIWQAGRTAGVEKTPVWDFDFFKEKCDS